MLVRAIGVRIVVDACTDVGLRVGHVRLATDD